MEARDKQQTGEKQDKGVEMGQDFEGDLVDLSEDESEDDSESNEGDEEKLDSQMGQGDGSEEIVDERLWDDKEDKDTEQQQEGEEKYEKGAPISRGKDDLEMRAKDDGEDKESGPDKNDTGDDELRSSNPADEGMQEHEDVPGDSDENNINQSDAYEDPSGVKPVKEEDDFELPDNMELDGDDDDGDGKGDANAGEEISESNQAPNVDANSPDSASDPKTLDDDHPEQETEEANEQNLDAMEVDAVQSGINEEAVEGNDGEKPAPSDLQSNANHTQSSAEQGGVEPQADPEVGDRDTRNVGGQPTADTYSGSAGNLMSAGRDENEGQQTGLEEAVGRDNEQNAQRELALETGQGGEATTSQNPGSSVDRQSIEKVDANPFRSLGDTLKQWKDRIRVRDEVSESGDVHMQQQKVEEPAVGDEYQYATGVEETELQALGGATEEQLHQQRLEDADEDDMVADDEVQPMMDRDAEGKEEEDQVSEMSQPRQFAPNRKQKSDAAQATGHAGVLEDEQRCVDLEGLRLDEELPSGKKGDSIVSVEAYATDDLQVKDQFMQARDAPDSQLTEKEVTDVRQEVEERMKAAAENAQVLWRRYDQLTARLSQELSEQLRLILEPTLAAKLEGDYKTGKRINMKKVCWIVEVGIPRMCYGLRFQCLTALNVHRSFHMLPVSSKKIRYGCGAQRQASDSTRWSLL